MDYPVRVLVVDDDAVDRMAVRRALRGSELRVHVEEAADSATALALLQQQPFNCVFLDYLMPGDDGLVMLRAARAAGITTPIVMLTGQGDEQLAVELMKSGATDYLSKARLSPENLAISLRNAIRVARAEEQVVLAETQRQEAEDALRESEARFRSMADSAPVLLWMSGTDALCYFFNQAWLRFTGRTMQQELGNDWVEGVHPEDYEYCFSTYMNAFAARQPFEVEFRLRRHDGAYRWLLNNGMPRFAPDGGFVGYIGSCVDIHERKRAEAEQRFLDEASVALSSSLDYQTRLSSMAHIVIPFLADWCAVDVLEEDGSARRLVIEALNPEHVLIEQELQQRYPLNPQAPNGAPAVLRTGQPELYPEISDEQLRTSARDEHHLELLRRTGLVSFMSLPLIARDKVLGAITLATAASGRRYGEADLRLAEELTRRAALAIDNARLYQEAKEAVRARDAFLSIAAHELKTPLTSLLGYTELLRRRAERDGTRAARDLRAMQVISDQAARLNKMIGSLLDLSRIQTGQLSIERTPVDLVALTERVVGEVQPTLNEHALNLAVEAQPLVVEGDELRLEQVLQNLIQNGVKYSPDGGAVTVCLQRRNGYALLSVADQGLGIPSDALPRLFSRFFRASNVHANNISGMGVGLYVVREIVTLHGGTISVDSQEGSGSTFTILLPLSHL